MRPSTSSLTATALLAAVSPVLAGTKEIWWNITYVQDANPDGLFARQVIGVNGTWPPPIIEVNSTDDLLVHASNSISQPTSIHHHGMFFNSTSWQDGAVGVSQCGIPVGESWDYVVPISTSGQHGTYWAHSHASGQYVDGLRTAVVIHPESEVHSYDDEYTIIISDWYHDQHDALLTQFISISNPGGAEPVPDSALVYFAQNTTYLGPIPGTNPTGATSAVGFNENATITFEPGKTYRLRIINVSAFSMFYFWIDGHEMRVIEADGTDTEEYSTDMLSVTVAQRYSILVTARNDTTPTNWAIHANMDTDMFDTVPDSLNPNVTSSITYDTSTAGTWTDSGFVDEYDMLNDIELVPSAVIAQYPPADVTIPLLVTFDTMDDGTNRAMFNGITYDSPLVPAVLSELTLGDNATVSAAYGITNFVWNHLDVIDIVLMNGDAGKHPFHLHGHTMQLVNRADDYTSDDPTLNPPLQEGQANPMRRDTVHVPSGSSVTLRVVADNPGVWFFHCHIEWHLEAGLAVTMIEAPLEAQSRAFDTSNPNYRGPPPSSLTSQCATLGQPTSGNAVGLNSTTDLTGLPQGPWQQNNGWHAKGIWAMFGCVLSAVLGMACVVWYSGGGPELSEREIEEEVREARRRKQEKGRFFGLVRPKAKLT